MKLPKTVNQRPVLRARQAFTLIELLTVMAIIGILTAMVLGVAGIARDKGARSRAEAEIAALSAALESYKADNGEYPPNDSATKKKPSVVAANSSIPSMASLPLYKALSGDLNADGATDAGQKAYFEFKPNMLLGTKNSSTGAVNPVTGISDPWGKEYGYYVPDPSDSTTIDRNPTFDLWTTSNKTYSGMSSNAASYEAAWIKNW